MDKVLAAVGGLEILAITGAIIAAAQRRVPVLIDGFIVSVAALAATRLNPSCRSWLLFSHRSAERGHSIVLDALGARPLIDLNLRLGEASGAATALPLLRLACALHNGMATFAEAAVSGPGKLMRIDLLRHGTTGRDGYLDGRTDAASQRNRMAVNSSGRRKEASGRSA